MADYEVKLVPRFDLSQADRAFIKSKIDAASRELNMAVHGDGITFSKKPPYPKLADIPAGVKFYFKMKQYEGYFNLLEYYSYLEGDINGRIIRSGR